MDDGDTSGESPERLTVAPIVGPDDPRRFTDSGIEIAEPPIVVSRGRVLLAYSRVSPLLNV